ncbi:MAG: hypothetical protein JNK63_05015 [Chthonomonas sp.]|nr:hypothetical protein [Chthonomonas sp.]
MRDDRELFYAAGEMTDAELLAFEQSLSPESEALKSAYASLRSLNDGIPEPQISFERVKQAIEAAPAQPSSIWHKWFVWATPLAAMGAIAIVMMRAEAPATFTESPTTVVAKASPSQPTHELHAQPEPQLPVDNAVVSESAPARPTISQRKVRRPRPVLVATNDNFGRRSSAPLTKSAPTNQGTDAGAPAPIRNADAIESTPTVAVSSEPVVVVSPNTDTKTGASSAMEVSKQGDDVLGG